MYSFLNKVILHSFLIFLSKLLEFLKFSTHLVLVSYKPVSHKEPCKISVVLTKNDFKFTASSFKLIYCEERHGAMLDRILCMFVFSAKLVASSDFLLMILLQQKTKSQLRIRIENVMTHVAIV